MTSKEALEKENQELKDKVNYYKNNFYATHKSAEALKDTIREFINILSIKELLKNVDYESEPPIREIFNKITQALDRLEVLEKTINGLITQIQLKIENAKNDYQRCFEDPNFPYSKNDELKGEILAYTDILIILERVLGKCLIYTEQ